MPGSIIAKQRDAARSRDQEIEPAVVIVVKKGRAHAAGKPLRLGELAHPVVVPQYAATRACDVHVQCPVVVVIAYGDCARYCPQSGTLIHKAAHAIIMKPSIAAVLTRDKDINTAIVVEIREARIVRPPRDAVGIREPRER